MIYILTIVYFLIFLFLYLQNRSRIINGFLFMILILLCGVSFINFTDQTGNRVLFYLVVIIAVILLLLNLFSSFIILIVTFFSSIQLIRKEGFRLSNCLSLASGLLFIIWIIVNALISPSQLSPVLYYGILLINTIMIYLLLIFTSFLFSSFIYQIYIPLRHQHYIIVLGSGLLNGKEVTPLLASRINRALKIFRHQEKNPPMIILSGGKGEDELVSESYAMKQYTLSQGINEKYLLMEDQSKNTYENLLFSKQLIENREKENKHLRVLFSTTNYHVCRAGMYAHQVKLKANGIGAPTKFYFWLNALLREFVAVCFMNKKSLTIGLVIALIVSLLAGVLAHDTEIFLDFIKMIKECLLLCLFH